MLDMFKKKALGTTTKFNIKGMHCTSCAMNIDGALEDTEGVISAETSYAKSQVTVSYNAQVVSEKTLRKIIAAEGYQVEA